MKAILTHETTQVVWGAGGIAGGAWRWWTAERAPERFTVVEIERHHGAAEEGSGHGERGQGHDAGELPTRSHPVADGAGQGEDEKLHQHMAEIRPLKTFETVMA